MEKLPDTEDPPSAAQLKELQAHAGSFNWLATRTRPDVSYWTSLLASTSTKQATWCQALAHKVLRYLAGTIDEGLVMSASGHADDLCIYTDAGFAGPATHAQNGLVILWGGTLITWRSSRAALSALSTAEAELCSAALGWQVAEGIRYLLTTVGIHVKRLRLFIDNKAALTPALLGSTWRTRYYAVRARRIYEEVQREAVQIQYCSTKDMAADALTTIRTRTSCSIARSYAQQYSRYQQFVTLPPYAFRPQSSQRSRAPACLVRSSSETCPLEDAAEKHRRPQPREEY